MALWGRRQKKEQERQQELRREQGAMIRRLEGEISSMSTYMLPATGSMWATSTFYSRRSDIDVLPPDPGRAAVKRESKKPTLEPILVDPPPLRPTRQFE